MRFFSLLISLNILTSCGYRWQPEYPHNERPTVSIPFIAGDDDGMLTSEIIRALSASGLVDVVSYEGNYQVKIDVQGRSSQNIGYRVDPQKVDGKVRKNLLAAEGRKTMSVVVSLVQGDKLAYGPYKISADAEYDYVDGDSIQDLTFANPNGQVVTVLPFSLGQLESLEAAQEAAEKPLYRHLAQKIVDAISSEW